MLTDPQSITVNTVAKSMPKVQDDGQHSVYAMADGSFKLDIRHTSRKVDKLGRTRSLATFTQTASVTDAITGLSRLDTLVFSVQIDRPDSGFSSTQVQQLVAGFNAWLTSTIVDKLYGRES
jgi:hypothetical protein